MICVHHNDPDGRAAAAVVALFHRMLRTSDRLVFLERASYQDPFPFDMVQTGEAVWIVDFSLDLGSMKRLMEITPKVTWIDHHESAIRDLQELSKMAGLRQVGVSGCELTWMHVFWGKDATSRELLQIPWCLQLIGDRDVWAFKFGDITRDFCAGLEIQDTRPESIMWPRLFSVDYAEQDASKRDVSQELQRSVELRKIVDQGHIIRTFIGKTGKEHRHEAGLEMQWQGHSCLLLNVWPNRSEMFGDPDMRGRDEYHGYDILIPFHYLGPSKRWKVGLYSPSVDVSVIAKEYGGGGHKGAAGFETDNIESVFPSVRIG